MTTWPSSIGETEKGDKVSLPAPLGQFMPSLNWMIPSHVTWEKAIYFTKSNNSNANLIWKCSHRHIQKWCLLWVPCVQSNWHPRIMTTDIQHSPFLTVLPFPSPLCRTSAHLYDSSTRINTPSSKRPLRHHHLMSQALLLHLSQDQVEDLGATLQWITWIQKAFASDPTM